MLVVFAGITIGILYLIVRILFNRAVKKAVRSEVFDITSYMHTRADSLWDSKPTISAPYAIECLAWDIKVDNHKSEKK